MNQSLKTTLSKYKKIILVGWWTGWHIQPIVSLTRHLRNSDTINDFLWIGGTHSQEEKIAQEENIQFVSIPTLKLTTTRSFKILLYPFFLKLGFWKARKILNKIKSWWKKMDSWGLGRETVWVRWEQLLWWVERTSFSLSNSFGTFSTKSTEKSVPKEESEQICVFSKWWPGSVAIGIAAWSLWIPLYIHESDTIPWRSNRILGRFATKIFLWFQWAKKYFDSNKCEVIWQILDPIFSRYPINQQSDQPTITWKTSKPHILVICGSQGSRAIFESIIHQFSGNNNYEWIIALGKLNSNMQDEFSKMSDCQALEWISQSDIAHLIQNTDIAISRWSATTLAELTSWDAIKPYLIIIPLPYSAWDHQYYNALEYEKIGHTLLGQDNLYQLTEIIAKNVWHNQ